MSLVEETDEPITDVDLEKAKMLYEQHKRNLIIDEMDERRKKRNRTIITILLALILLFIIISPIVNHATKDDITSKYTVTYTARLTDNDHVGSSWTKGALHDGNQIRSGVTVTDDHKLSITLWAEERDEETDYGSKTVTFKNLGVGETEKQTVYVIVSENRGRYAGNTATWIFTVTVKRTA